MQPTDDHILRYLTGPIVSQWFARFGAARDAKARFDTMAKLCRQFLGSSAKAMWEDAFRREFYPGISQPGFMVSLNKAFELVAVIGPSLMWQNPSREIHSAEPPDQLGFAQLLGVTDPSMLQQIQMMQQQDVAVKEVRNTLLARVMEALQRNHPGGIMGDWERNTQEALVTGVGCVWQETFTDKVTGAIRVGSFFDTVDNLLIDPDARDPQWRDVRWLSRRHVDKIWEVERRFGYPPGYLHGKGTHVSAEYLAKRNALEPGKQIYHDCIEWYEIWSVGGIGARVTGIDSGLGEALDQLTGDYCYLCITQGLSHPLNLPPHLLSNGSAEIIREAMRWRTANFGMPIDLWKDRRWPVEATIFYPIENTVWPMAPLGPGMGALLAMNILLVSQLQASWDRRRDIIAAYEHSADQVLAAMKSEDNPAVIRINAASGLPLQDVVGFIQRPEVQGNLLEWMQYLDQAFQMATGLDDIHYGITQKQARVTSDVTLKEKASNIRPEKMRRSIQQAVVNASTKEMWLTCMYVQGAQLVSLIGPWGAMAWDAMIHSLTFEELVDEFSVWVEAIDLERPNRDKDMADLERLAPFLLPIYQAYCPASGDSKPLNAFLHHYARAMQMRDPEDLYLGQWTPPADPAMQQMQQQMLQLDADKTAAQTDEIRAKAVARLIDAQYKQKGAAAPALQRMQWAELFNQQKLRQQEQSHLQAMIHLQEQQNMERADATSSTGKR